MGALTFTLYLLNYCHSLFFPFSAFTGLTTYQEHLVRYMTCISKEYAIMFDYHNLIVLNRSQYSYLQTELLIIEFV